ncbi:MAG: multicopper oxidase domain-containing protein [Deltaproteobacteria bacterium]|nr:multicopper oxidase domain-containing protein [Deltaproteobacteria bacterium]
MATKPIVRVLVVVLAAAGLLAAWAEGVAWAQPACPAGQIEAVPGAGPCVLDPAAIPKFVSPLVIPPVMPQTRKSQIRGEKNAEYYEIAVRQFAQQILPTGLPQTTVWGYGSVNHPGTFNAPSFTIEATAGKPVRVRWMNELVDAAGAPLPHLLPVDPTLHWANPIGMRDHRPPADPTDPYWTNPYIDFMGRYVGPVPIVTHVHGAETFQESDGYPEAWYLPAGVAPGPNLPWTTGTFYDHFKMTALAGAAWAPGSAVFDYPNTQRATTLWYHDHALGMTRLNVYAGPAGFYLLRGGPSDAVTDAITGLPAILPAPAPRKNDQPGQRTYYEIPIAIQDRSFNPDGSLFYPDNRAFFEGVGPADLQIPFIPGTTALDQLSDVAPIWNPEFFGNTIMVNGKTWPFLQVEARRYRLRLLNGCQSRFLILQASDPAVQIWQIGAEGGFLPAPLDLNTATGGQILLGPAERADVIVDFAGVAPGTTVTLLNLGPDEPFGGGMPGMAFPVADPLTTGMVMEFRVVAPVAPDPTTPPAQLQLAPRIPLPASTITRLVSLNEEDSATVCVLFDPVADAFVVPIAEVACDSVAPAGLEVVPFGPAAAKLGTYDAVNNVSTPLMWDSLITELPQVGSTETWEIWNFTMDAHPIHIHLVQFEVVNREVWDPTMSPNPPGVRPPEPWETGTKDTVIVYPGELARVKATFSNPGLFVWHCLILEHEDNEMMRPYCVTNANGTRDPACDLADQGHTMPGPGPGPMPMAY